VEEEVKAAHAVRRRAHFTSGRFSFAFDFDFNCGRTRSRAFAGSAEIMQSK
jgi:hypothetical protein